MERLFSATTHTQLSHSCVLWFEVSNQYIIVPTSIKALLDVYFASGSALEFENHLQSVLDISRQDSKTYYAEISELLKSAQNPQESDLLKTSEVPQIEKSAFKDFYSFGSMGIRLHQG